MIQKQTQSLQHHQLIQIKSNAIYTETIQVKHMHKNIKKLGHAHYCFIEGYV